MRQSMGKTSTGAGRPFSFSNANFSPLIDCKAKIDEDDLEDNKNEFNWSNRDLAQLRKERNSVLKSELKGVDDLQSKEQLDS